MKSSRFVSLAAAALLAFSSATANAGVAVVTPAHNSSGFTTGIWILFGCSGTIIFTALVKHHRYHRELTPLEATTCGFAYWFNPRNHP